MQHYFPLLFALLLLSGCAGKRTHLFEDVRNELRASKQSEAYAAYKKGIKGDTERVDELLNLGLLAFEAGDYANALTALHEADRLAEERLTKSFSRESAAMAISDRVRAYQGTIFDKAMLHYYASLAYLELNEPESAVVEGRRIASYLEVNARESKHTYKDDAFLQWYSGSLYHKLGEVNDAWISYKRACELYDGGFFSLPEPSFLCPVTLQAARKVGHAESVEDLELECGDDSYRSDWGRVIVLCEAGLAPPIKEDNIVFPILKYEKKYYKDEDERDAYAMQLYDRGPDYHYEATDLKYLLRVALPFYEENYSGTFVRNAVVRADSNEFRAEPVTNIGAILRQDLSDRMPAIAVRAITRALIKYAASEAAEEAGGGEEKTAGWILGKAINLLGAVTEAADTRSWETLPDRIYAADFQLPPGTHNLRAIFKDNSGSILLRQDFTGIDVKPGEIQILRARCLQ